MVDYQQVYEDIAAKRGGELTQPYINNKTKLHLKCKKGHEWAALPSNVKRGTWCRKCISEERTTPRHNNLLRAHEVAEKRGGRCFETENLNVTATHRWECNKGHKWRAILINVLRGTWCVACVREERKGNVEGNTAQAHRIAAAQGGKCLSNEVPTIRSFVNMECKAGHTWSPVFYSIQRGNWCPHCVNKTEGFCFDVICALFPMHEFRKRNDLPWLRSTETGRSLELDIFNEELRLALEYNGAQHDISVKFYGGDATLQKVQQRDKMKADACDVNDICLLVVRDLDTRKFGGHKPDRYKIVDSIWKQVTDLGYPQNVHLETKEDLLASLGM